MDDDSNHQLRDHLECPICFEIFSAPKLLPCQHTFCEHCLRGTIMDEVSVNTTRGVHKFSFSCPVCRQETLPPHPDLSPDEWARLFPTNLLAASLIDSMPSLKVREGTCPPRQQRAPVYSLPVSNSTMDASRTPISERPSREYGYEEYTAPFEEIPSLSDETLDLESIIGIARCMKEGCLELKQTEESNLEKLRVLNSISDLSPEEECRLESLRCEIMTRLSELNLLQDAIAATEMLMESNFQQDEEDTLELSSDIGLIRSQLSEYEQQLRRLNQRAKEASVSHILENLKNNASRASGGGTKTAHESNQAHSISSRPNSRHESAQPSFAMNHYPVLMFYPNQPTFQLPSAPYPPFVPDVPETMSGETITQDINKESTNEKPKKWTIFKWRKKFFKSN